MCHTVIMTNLMLSKIALVAATSLALLPTAIADEASVQDGIPYEITFNGDIYPAELDTMEYPYIAASQERSGECQLSINADASGNIMGMSIVSCSDELFKSVATRYIAKQSFGASTPSKVSAHSLQIRWNIGEDLEAIPLQLASR